MLSEESILLLISIRKPTKEQITRNKKWKSGQQMCCRAQSESGQIKGDCIRRSTVSIQKAWSSMSINSLKKKVSKSQPSLIIEIHLVRERRDPFTIQLIFPICDFPIRSMILVALTRQMIFDCYKLENQLILFKI